MAAKKGGIAGLVATRRWRQLAARQGRFEIGAGGAQALQLILGPHELKTPVHQHGGAIRVMLDNIERMRCKQRLDFTESKLTGGIMQSWAWRR